MTSRVEAISGRGRGLWRALALWSEPHRSRESIPAARLAGNRRGATPLAPGAGRALLVPVDQRVRQYEPMMSWPPDRAVLARRISGPLSYGTASPRSAGLLPVGCPPGSAVATARNQTRASVFVESTSARARFSRSLRDDPQQIGLRIRARALFGEGGRACPRRQRARASSRARARQRRA
jgi:hypothetical protein